MRITAGIDVGSTWTKALLLREDGEVLGRALLPSGYQLEQAATTAYRKALAAAGVAPEGVGYVACTGFGRFQVPFRDVQVTDLTAQARGARFLFPGTNTVLDVGGQTMKATRVDAAGKVQSFRLNDKCAAGTGAFLEKAARYLGFGVEEIGPLAATSHSAVPISGVCAVFAESEVINHVSSGAAPADIMQGAIASLVERSLQLLKRVKVEPEVALVGGILRYRPFAKLLEEKLGCPVRVPDETLVQHVGALGAAVLGLKRLAAPARAAT